MTERKPKDVAWDSWAEAQIRVAMERGEFEDLPGAGKPFRDLDKPLDDMWWVKELLKRENLSFLPPALSVRKELEDALERIAKANTESAVREIVAAINARIVHVNSRATSGPPTSVSPLKLERVLEEWRRRRPGPAT